MQELDQYSVTEAVLEQMSSTPNPRLKAVMEIVIRHVHEILREADLTPDELFKGIQFLTEVGQKCTPNRQEFMILSAVTGVESVVNVLNDLRTAERGTRTSIFGPFYVGESPLHEERRHADPGFRSQGHQADYALRQGHRLVGKAD